MKRFYFVILILLIGITTNALSQTRSELRSAGPEIRSRGPLAFLLTYQHNLIVLSNEKAIAVVDLTEEKPFEVSYQYRLLDLKTGKTTQGEGTLFDQPDSEKKSQPLIQFGAFRQQWSYSAQGRGWIYYYPELVHIQMVKRILTDDTFKSLDLSRFVQFKLGQSSATGVASSAHVGKAALSGKPRALAFSCTAMLLIGGIGLSILNRKCAVAINNRSNTGTCRN